MRPSGSLRWLAALVLLLALAGCKVALYSNLKEQEANEIVAALSNEGIGATKTKLEGANWQVEVEEDRLSQALDVLRVQGLPAERYVSMGEVFQKQGLVSTPSEERMRYIYAMSQELSQTLRNIDGVVDARVHVVIPADRSVTEALSALRRDASRLRSEVAMAITRKRAPELSFVPAFPDGGADE